MSPHEKSLYELIVDHLGKEVFIGAKALDVGSYLFKAALEMQQAGSTVTALDRCLHAETPEGIDFVHSDFLKWEPGASNRFDIAYLSRVAMFMPSTEVMQKVASLDPRVVAVRTMSAYPEPNWPPEKLRQMHFTMPDDWKAYFEARGYDTVHAEAYDHHHPDLSGVPRLFHMVDFITVKK